MKLKKTLEDSFIYDNFLRSLLEDALKSNKA